MGGGEVDGLAAALEQERWEKKGKVGRGGSGKRCKPGRTHALA